jgi:hypothetical protein
VLSRGFLDSELLPSVSSSERLLEDKDNSAKDCVDTKLCIVNGGGGSVDNLPGAVDGAVRAIAIASLVCTGIFRGREVRIVTLVLHYFSHLWDLTRASAKILISRGIEGPTTLPEANCGFTTFSNSIIRRLPPGQDPLCTSFSPHLFVLQVTEINFIYSLKVSLSRSSGCSCVFQFCSQCPVLIHPPNV